MYTVDYIEKNCHWLKKINDYHYEMYLDHHSLSTFRQCEQFFIHTMVEGWKPRREVARMPWFFAFGIVVHDCLEWMYLQKEASTYDNTRMIDFAMSQWHKRDMDAYKEEKAYQTLGAQMGFVALIVQYSEFYSKYERLRPIGTEIVFGKGKEVPLGKFYISDYKREIVLGGSGELYETSIKIDCYLAGRIDFLMENANSIGPMDHKTMAYIPADPLGKYDPQEGMTGYVFANKHIINKNFPELAEKKATNIIWMNFISVAANDDLNKRFKRLPLYKTDWQLEQFRVRQLKTFRRIFEIFYYQHDADWNTSICDNMFRRSCMFKGVHRQGSLDSAFTIMNNDFQQVPIWNPDLSHEGRTED